MSGNLVISKDALWNYGIMTMLALAIVLITYFMLRGFKRYIGYRIEQWRTGSRKRNEDRGDDDED